LGFAAALAAVAALGAAALHWPMPLHPASWEVLALFTPSHGWAFDHIARMLCGELPWSETTARLGWPRAQHLSFIAWGPAVLVAPLNRWLGPAVAVNAAAILLPVAAGLAAAGYARRAVGAGAVAAAAAGLVFAFCPPMIAALANGQLCKGNLWGVAAGAWAFEVAVVAWWGLPIFAATVFAATFSEPTYGILLSLLLPVRGAWLMITRRGATLVLVPVAGAVFAAILLVARGYYTDDSGVASAFAPTGVASPDDWRNYVQWIATPGGLTLGRTYVASVRHGVHVDYLGIPAILALFLAWRGKGRAAIVALVVTGLLVAVGPWLVTDAGPVRVGGRMLSLPVRWLTAAGFPLAQSGTYYRAMALTWLGVALAVGASGRWAPLWLGLLLADTLRVTSTLWPIPSRPIPGLGTFAAMGDVKNRGPVGELTMAQGNFELGEHMFAAAFHGRPVSAIPADTRLPPPGDVDRAVRTGNRGAVLQALAGTGWAIAVWRAGDPDRPLAAYTAVLGEGTGDDAYRWWPVGG
jgi:hypothetical protein